MPDNDNHLAEAAGTVTVLRHVAPVMIAHGLLASQLPAE